MIDRTVKPDPYARDVTPAEFRDLAISIGWTDARSREVIANCSRENHADS